MSTQAERTDAPMPENSKSVETPADKRLNRAAEEAAEKAGKTEQRYDRDHNIFTK
jgi:hypothetical protein